jgi:uncharacterized protein (DUF1015 family)
MVDIRPFPALRPKPELAPRICELPYDVMSTDEARQAAAGNPLSFLRISKPEIDLAANTNPYDEIVYKTGQINFLSLISQGCLQLDQNPQLYLYQQVMGAHHQTGIVAIASCQDYLQNVIKRHELTRPDKELDRVRHIEALNAQTGPAFLTARFSGPLYDLVREIQNRQPWTDFVTKDKVRHTGWNINDTKEIQQIQEEFRGLPALYIADGHHRSAAAIRIFQARGGKGECGYFLGVIFPHDQLQILPYNRAVTDLNGLSRDSFMSALKKTFKISVGVPKPEAKHLISLYIDHQWYRLEFRPDLLDASQPVERLDVHLLQHHVLKPLLGIEDPRTSKRIGFIGGIRGTLELERLVNEGEYACAFSLYPTEIEELMSIADAGEIMPPKSTWFEPKLRDGLYCHMI